MRRIILGSLLLTLCLGTFAFGETLNRQANIVNRATIVTAPRSPHNPLDEIIYFENWESGFNGWTSQDLTAVSSTWHLDTYQAFGGSGTSWWVGDPAVGTNGGYLDAWYMVLDSPPIQLGTTPNLRFWHRYSVEPPGGEPAPYNGWDGMNLRISTNGGASWTVIPSAAVTPAYDRTSLYSFGVQHGEGPNVPGWCGMTGSAWHVQTANLSTWANQSVKIRWAFASDPAYSTPDNSALFGWMFDAVRVYSGTDTVFSHDANSATGWTAQSMVPVGGDLWRIANDPTSPYGPSILVCNDPADNLYDINMDDVIESPYIDLRGRPNGVVLADVFVAGSLVNSGPCPGPSLEGCDYWGIDVSSDSGMSWCAISNPECLPGVDNFVYIDCPTTWSSFNESYTTPMDMSVFLGQVIKFRLQFQSAATPDVDYGPKFDCFSVTYTPGSTVSISGTAAYHGNNIPINGESLSIAPGGSTTTNASGAYQFTGLNIGTSYTVTPDRNTGPSCNASISFFDASLAAQYAIGIITLDSVKQAAADVSGNGQVSFLDASLIAQYAIGLINQFPCNARWCYRPAHRSYNPLTGTQTNQNYDGMCMGDVSGNWAGAVLAGGSARSFSMTKGVFAARNVVAESAYAIEFDCEYDPSAVRYVNAVLREGLQNWYLFTREEPGVVHVGAFGVTPVETGSDIVRLQFEPLMSSATQSALHIENYRLNDSPALSGIVEWEQATLPVEYALEQNYPNPFNPITTIAYNLPRDSKVRVTVSNILGETVEVIADGVQNAGRHTVQFDASALSSGIYFYRIEAGNFRQIRKMVVLK